MPRSSRALLPTLVLTTFASLGSAADDVEVERFDGSTLEGELVESDGERLSVRVDGSVEAIPTRDLVSLRVVEPAAADPPRNVVEIANGDRLVATPLDADEDVLRVQWPSAGAEPVAIPLETVRGVAWQLSRDRARREATLAELRLVRGEGDRLISENGDYVLGEFRGLVDGTVTLFVASAKTSVPVERLRALAFDPTLVTPPSTPGRVLVRLVDGSLVTAKNVEIDGERLRIDTVFGPTVDVPRDRLAALRFVGGRATDLSDRIPLQFDHTPWLGLKWGWGRDRAVTGTPLRIGDRDFAKGIGMHSHSRLVYDVHSGDRTFRATVGLDATAGDGGSVRFVVQLDGVEVYRSNLVRGGDDPFVIPPVDLAEAERLELVVEYADRGDVLDRANWCDALVVRE